MTEGRPPRPKRGLKTWSSLGQLGRIPSEYEVVTHNLNYTTRPNRTSALESNPTTPANMWFLTYRDKSPLQADDWRGFRDPDEITYRTYVTMQDEQETAVERVLDEYGSAGHDASLPPQWAECLATLFTPTRFPVHALQMCTAYLGYIAPASVHLQLRRVRGRGPAAPGVTGGLPDAAACRCGQVIHRQHRTGRMGA